MSNPSDLREEYIINVIKINNNKLRIQELRKLNKELQKKINNKDEVEECKSSIKNNLHDIYRHNCEVSEIVALNKGILAQLSK